MMITKDQENFFFGNENDDYEDSNESEDDGFLPSRTGVVNKRFRWKKRKGVAIIPYIIYGKSHYSELTIYYWLIFDLIESTGNLLKIAKSTQILKKC